MQGGYAGKREAETLAEASALRLASRGSDTESLEAAVILLKQVAHQNVTESRDAHYVLGEMYDFGEIWGSSPTLAEHHYLQAASFGSHEALFKLALLDPLQATESLGGVVTSEGGVAQFTGTVDIQQSLGPTTGPAAQRRHPVQQLSQYQTAAQAANPDAAIALAYRYKFGVDVVENCSLAATYYEFAVNSGMAEFVHGSLDAVSGVESELPAWPPRHGVQLMKKAKGFSASRNQETTLYHEYYQYSAAGGDAGSQYQLGKLLYNAGVEAATLAATSSHSPSAGRATAGFRDNQALGDANSSLKQAFELFMSAAEAGSAEAHAGLGHMYYQV